MQVLFFIADVQQGYLYGSFLLDEKVPQGELKATFPITIMTLTTFGSILNLIYTAVWKFIQLYGNEPCLDVNLTENTVLLPNGQMNQQLPVYCA